VQALRLELLLTSPMETIRPNWKAEATVLPRPSSNQAMLWRP
jgi:hypothetical protein